MTTKINGKTPEEIKKGLECCIEGGPHCCDKCPYNEQGCADDVNLQDALTYIQQLERERDAAIADLAEKPRCENCKHFTPGYFCIGCRRGERWEWRGVKE